MISHQGRPLAEAGLDSLRAVAAVMVFIYHLRWIAGEPVLLAFGIDWQPRLRAFDGGVCLFFVLSGYLLSGPFWDGLAVGAAPNLRRYALRRLGRIIPAYWLVLGAYAVIVPGAFSLWGLTSVLLQAVGLHTFAEYAYAGCVPVLWSIGIELQFYAILPLLFLATGWMKRGRTMLVLIGMALLAVGSDSVWQLVASAAVGKVPGKILGGFDSAVICQSIFHFLRWFWIGIAASLLVRSSLKNLPTAAWDALFVCGVGAFAVLLANAEEGEWRLVSTCGWPMGPAACALIVVSTPRSRIGRAILDHSLMRWMGAVSYGLYLWHWPVLKAVFAGTLPAILGPQAAFFVCGGIAFLATVGVSLLSHVVIERPAIAWAKRARGFGDAWAGVRDLLRLESASSTRGQRPSHADSSRPPAAETRSAKERESMESGQTLICS